MVHVYIVLDTPTAIFQPLSTVSGRVIVENLKPLNVQSISLKVSGKASVKFFRSCGNHTVTYKKSENYIQKRLILWTKKDDEKLSIGSHAYRFKFQLPEKCLPQFNNKIGKIVYKLEAAIDIPWSLNKCKEITINVSPSLDLTKEITLLKPITYVTQEPLNASVSCFQKNSPVQLIISCL
uniref:Arrestin-like N-terminal domain-containing protein n=1 Tax=Panagrolaimus davidi TaxID=227884 RepID=A0A914QT82_9BILA